MNKRIPIENIVNTWTTGGIAQPHSNTGPQTFVDDSLRNIMAHMTHAGTAVLASQSRDNLYNLKMALKNLNRWAEVNGVK